MRKNIGVGVRKRIKECQLTTVIILISISIISFIIIEEKMLYPFVNKDGNLNYYFFTNSNTKCIMFHPIIISVYKDSTDSMSVYGTFDKILECNEEIKIDSNVTGKEKYSIKVNDKFIENKDGVTFLKSTMLDNKSNILFINISGLNSYYNYYQFRAKQTTIDKIEFNIPDNYICENDCVGVRKGNVKDVININGKSITYRFDSSLVELIFTPKHKLFSYGLAILLSIIAGLILFFLQIVFELSK